MTKMTMTRRTMNLVLGTALATGLFALPQTASAQENLENLPDTMIWSTYDVGSTGYVEASAIADALIKQYGTRVRLLPSGSGIGRMLPVREGQAMSGYLANELYFSTRGLYEFAAKEWGPQDFRVVAGRPSSYGIAVTAESGITTPEDLRGKRIAYAAANPSISIKNDALLAGAGLTRDDVEVVEFPSYADSMRSLIEGQADAVGVSTTSAVLYELESSPRGIAWVEMDPDNDEIWNAMKKVAPFFAPSVESVGAGITEDDPQNLTAYRYPMITVPADADADMIYAYLKAIDETFPMYKDAAPIMKNWAIEEISGYPQDAPFHEGAIRYLKEKGLWTDGHQEWNDSQIKIMTSLQEAWDEYTSGPGADLEGEEFQNGWTEKRDAIMNAG